MDSEEESQRNISMCNVESDITSKFSQYRQNIENNNAMMHEMLAFLASKQDEFTGKLNTYKTKMMEDFDETIEDLEKKTYRIENLCYRLEKRVTSLEAVDIAASLESTTKCSAEEVEQKLAKAFEHFENHFVDMLKRDLKEMEEKGHMERHKDGEEHVLPFATFTHLGSAESRLKNLIRKTNNKVDMALERISGLKKDFAEKAPQQTPGQSKSDSQGLESKSQKKSITEEAQTDQGDSMSQSSDTPMDQDLEGIDDGDQMTAERAGTSAATLMEKRRRQTIKKKIQAADELAGTDRKLAEMGRRLGAFEKALNARLAKLERQVGFRHQSRQSTGRSRKTVRRRQSQTVELQTEINGGEPAKRIESGRWPFSGDGTLYEEDDLESGGLSSRLGGFFSGEMSDEAFFGLEERPFGSDSAKTSELQSKMQQTEAKLSKFISIMRTTMSDFGVDLPWDEVEAQLAGQDAPSPPVQATEAEERWATPRPTTGKTLEEAPQDSAAGHAETSATTEGKNSTSDELQDGTPSEAVEEKVQYKMHMNELKSNNQEEEDTCHDKATSDEDGEYEAISPMSTARRGRGMDESGLLSLADKIAMKIQQRKVDRNMLKKKMHQRHLGLKGLNALQDRMEELEQAVISLQKDHEMFEVICTAFATLDETIEGVTLQKLKETIAQQKKEEQAAKDLELEVSIRKLKRKLEKFSDGMDALIEDPLEICPTEAKQILEECPKIQVLLQTMGTKGRYTMDILGVPDQTGKLIKERKFMGYQIMRAVVQFAAIVHVALNGRVYLEDMSTQPEGHDKDKIKYLFEGVDLDHLNNLPMIQRGPGTPVEDTNIHLFLVELAAFLEGFLSHCTNLGRVLIEQELAFEQIEIGIRKKYEEDHAAEQEELLNNFENVKGRIRGVSNKMSTFEESVNQMVTELRDGFGNQDVLKDMEKSVNEVRTRMLMLKAEVDFKKGGPMEASLDKMAERLHIALNKAPAQLEQVAKILERKADTKYVNYLEAQVAELSGQGPNQPFLSVSKCLSCNQEISGGAKQRASFNGVPGQMWHGADEKYMMALNTSIPLSSLKGHQDTQPRVTLGKIYPHLHNIAPYVPPDGQEPPDQSKKGKMRSVSLFDDDKDRSLDQGDKVVISKYPRLVPVINGPEGNPAERSNNKLIKGKKLVRDKT